MVLNLYASEMVVLLNASTYSSLVSLVFLEVWFLEMCFTLLFAPLIFSLLVRPKAANQKCPFPPKSDPINIPGTMGVGPNRVLVVNGLRYVAAC